MNRNLLILILSQIFSFTAAPVTVFLSGIIGSQMSPLKSLATLPMSISVVGIAIGAKGLGQDVLEALQYANVGQGILAGIAILFVALILDRVVQGKKRV